MLIESELFFQAIIKPVIIRFAYGPYSLSSKELDLLNWYSNKFGRRLADEVSSLDELAGNNLNTKIFSDINLLNEK